MGKTFAVAAVVLGLVSCSGTYCRAMEGLGIEKRDILVDRVEDARDAQGEATLEVEHQGQTFRGRGVSTDTVEASIKAILDAVNRIAMTEESPVST